MNWILGTRVCLTIHWCLFTSNYVLRICFEGYTIFYKRKGHTSKLGGVTSFKFFCMFTQNHMLRILVRIACTSNTLFEERGVLEKERLLTRRNSCFFWSRPILTKEVKTCCIPHKCVYCRRYRLTCWVAVFRMIPFQDI